MQPPPQTPGVPPPPHVCGGVHMPQLIWPPQPSPAGPQCRPRFAHVCGAHICTYGVTHEVRSKIRYSNTFSCGVRAPCVQVGKVPPALTWKWLVNTRPPQFACVSRLPRWPTVLFTRPPTQSMLVTSYFASSAGVSYSVVAPGRPRSALTPLSRYIRTLPVPEGVVNSLWSIPI